MDMHINSLRWLQASIFVDTCSLERLDVLNLCTLSKVHEIMFQTFHTKWNSIFVSKIRKKKSLEIPRFVIKKSRCLIIIVKISFWCSQDHLYYCHVTDLLHNDFVRGLNRTTRKKLFMILVSFISQNASHFSWLRSQFMKT